jgi:glycosyltransferase involved in cell wall biosynthesis
MRSAERPNILFVTSHWPHAPKYGAQQRALNIGRLLTRCGHVSLIVASADEPDAETLRKTGDEFDLRAVMPLEPHTITAGERLRCELDPRFMNTHYRVASPQARDAMLRAIDAHNIVWVFGLHEANAFGIYRWPHTILDIDDVQSRAYTARARAESNLFTKLLNHRMAMIWRRRERRLIERFDVVTVCSEDDRRYLGGGAAIRVVPNGFTAPATVPIRSPQTPPRFGFIGLCDYGPNRDGVDWFTDAVWPIIKRALPDARLRLAGRGSEAALSAAPDVDVLGYVDNAADEIAGWTAMIVPIRFGGGTRVKIAEAFSRCCPVVSTSLGAVGYDTAEQCLLLGDEPATFAAACIQLAMDPSLGRRLASRGWREFTRKWTWDAIEASVGDCVRLCIERSGAMRSARSRVAATRTDACSAT